MCVCVYICVYGMHVYISSYTRKKILCTWLPETDFKCLPQLHSFYFLAGSPWTPRSPILVSLTAWLTLENPISTALPLDLGSCQVCPVSTLVLGIQTLGLMPRQQVLYLLLHRPSPSNSHNAWSSKVDSSQGEPLIYPCGF